jgi:hypothetical protein
MPDQSGDLPKNVLWWAIVLILIGLALVSHYYGRFM